MTSGRHDDAVDALTLSADPTVDHLDPVALTAPALPGGAGFPPSYRRYVTRCGWGRLFGLWLIYPPVLPGFADGWSGRADRLDADFHGRYRRARVDGFDWKTEPDGDWEPAGRLRLFGHSENGDGLLWDPQSIGADGEAPVYLSPGWDAMELLGPSLSAALTPLRARCGAFAERAPADVEPLPAVRW